MNPRNKSHPARWVAYAAVFALIAAACGGDDEPSPTTAAPTTAAPTTAAAPPATEAPMEEEELRPVPTLRIITKTAAEGPPRYEQARLIAESWTAGGIPAEIEPVESSELGRRGFTVKDFDVYIIIYDPTTDRLDPENFLARFTTGKAVVDGSNLSGYTNPAYDDLYQAQVNATSFEERIAAVHEMQQLLHDHQPVAPFIHIVIGGAYNSADWTNFTKSVGTPVYHFWNAIGLTPTGDPEPLVIGITSGAQTLNPVVAATSEAAVTIAHMYDPLLRIGPDGDLINWAASDYSIDGSTVSVTLRDGMTFHDGEAVTGEDVAFTFNYLVEKESPLYGGRLGPVESVTADGNNVEITLSAPNAAFATTALAQVPILPEHVWSSIDDPSTFANDEPIGSGPFKFESRALGEDLRLDAHTDHFSPPAAPGLVWAVFGSLDGLLAAIETREIDVLGDFVSLTQLSLLEGVEGVSIESNTGHGVNALHYNMRREPFCDLHMRLALSYLVPTEDMIDIVYEGVAAVSNGIIAPPLWANPDVSAVPYDPDTARSHLEAAGYVFGDDGTLYYPPSDADNRDMSFCAS
jgi:peptide/nickel transport system substrate-binding protein